MRYIAYIRKSTEEEVRQSLSIPAQTRKITEVFPDMSIVRWMEPESKSAFTPGRPIFNEMMALLRAGYADGVVAWHPDRLSRNEVDAAHITYALRTGEIKDLKFCSYYFDNSPEGILMLQNVMSHSQYYSSKLSKDVKRGMDEQRKRGWPTYRAIEGYKNTRSKGANHGIIVKDPKRFPLRRRMWDLMLTGEYSVPQVGDIANKQWGYKTRGDKRNPPSPISRTALYKMFNNPRYAGKIPVPGRPGVYEQGAYEPMVTEEEFDTVQDLLGKHGAPKLKPKKSFRYRGIIFCGECGCVITAEEKTKRFKNGSFKKYIYYHCTRKRPCTQRQNLSEENIEQQFAEMLGKYTILPEFKDWALEALANQNEIESTDFTAILESQCRAIEAKHRELNNLIKMASKELISDDQFIDGKSSLEKEIKNLEEEREGIKHRANTWYEAAERIFDLAVNGRDKFLHGTLEEKREVLRDIGSNPVILDGKLLITPHPWLIPIERDYKALEAEYLKVRTLPKHLQNEPMEAVRSAWLGTVDEVRTYIIVYTTM